MKSYRLLILVACLFSCATIKPMNAPKKANEGPNNNPASLTLTRADYAIIEEIRNTAKDELNLDDMLMEAIEGLRPFLDALDEESERRWE